MLRLKSDEAIVEWIVVNQDPVNVTTLLLIEADL